MKQVHRSILTLTAVGAFAAAAGLWVTAGDHGVEAGVAATDAPLTWAAGAPVDVTVTAVTGSYRLAEKEGAWRVVHPYQDAASDAAIRELLAVLSPLQAAQIYGQNGAPAAPAPDAMGLSNPALTIAWQAAGPNGAPGEVFTLRVGKQNAFDKRYYASLSQEAHTAYGLIGGTVLSAAMRQVDGLRERKLFDVSGRDDVMRLSVTPAAPSPAAVAFTLVRELDGSGEEQPFVLSEPALGLADQDRVRTLLNLVTSARVGRLEQRDGPASNTADAGAAGSTADAGKADAGPDPFDTPDITVELAARDGVQRVAIITRADGTHWAKTARRPWIGELDDSTYSALLQTADALRDKRLVHFERGVVRRIELEHADGVRWRLEKQASKTGDRWVMLSPLPGALRREKIEQLLFGLTTLSGSHILVEAEDATDKARAAHGLSAPVLRVQLFGQQGQALGGLRFGADVVPAAGSEDPPGTKPGAQSARKPGPQTTVPPHRATSVAATSTSSTRIMAVPKSRLSLIPKSPKAWLVR